MMTARYSPTELLLIEVALACLRHPDLPEDVRLRGFGHMIVAHISQDTMHIHIGRKVVDVEFDFSEYLDGYVEENLSTEDLTDEILQKLLRSGDSASISCRISTEAEGFWWFTVQATAEGDLTYKLTRPQTSAPWCPHCVIEMLPTGSCFACASCGATSGRS
jgi:hypothetical protein